MPKTGYGMQQRLAWLAPLTLTCCRSEHRLPRERYRRQPQPQSCLGLRQTLGGLFEINTVLKLAISAFSSAKTFP